MDPDYGGGLARTSFPKLICDRRRKGLRGVRSSCGLLVNGDAPRIVESGLRASDRVYR
jgi:hypothetical protein